MSWALSSQVVFSARTIVVTWPMTTVESILSILLGVDFPSHHVHTA
ncbi:MAG: hypothetical protein H6Q51_1377 [Deltaproteobacteria bacterium]|nr:hypothetical protein [Deltaproteobacteria bacterium]